MYINNVRSAIQNLYGSDYDDYLKRLRLVLRRKYQKNVKPSELKQRVDEFANGKDPKIDYFEAYLITFDELILNGAIKALDNKKNVFPNTWRQLLVKITDDQPISPDIVKHIQDEQIVVEIKALFYHSIYYCKGKNKQDFFTNLQTFNQFLKIKNVGS